MAQYQPPFTVSNKMLALVADISEAIGRLSANFVNEEEQALRLRKINQMRTIQGSLAIEGNTLTIEQITSILEGKRVIAPPKEVQEAHNAISTYKVLLTWQPSSEHDLLKAHKKLMFGLMPDAGMWRSGGVGVMLGDKVVHMAPPADLVPKLMKDLLLWLAQTDYSPLIASCIFHYEFEFIHPFADGNGRLGRLWQTLILSKWREVFINIPVESLVYQHQSEYYQAINQSTKQSDCAPFVEFMLQMISNAINEGSSGVIFEGIEDSINDGINEGTSDGLNGALNEGENKDVKYYPRLTELDKKIIALLKCDAYLTHTLLAEKVQKSISTVERRIKYLKDNGLVVRVGAKKSGRWLVSGK